VRVETATSSGVAAVYAGFAAIVAGLHRSVLVVGGEKMSHLPTPRVSEIIGRSIDPHERTYGTTMPALAGLITRAATDSRGAHAQGRCHRFRSRTTTTAPETLSPTSASG
jgi:acetyl-CoA C-acetyltransferase